MTHTRPLTAAAVVVAGLLAGCGGSSSPSVSPSSRLEQVPGSSATRIVLSAVGAHRIGLRTTRVRSSGGGSRTAHVAIPYSAVIYDPDGKTFAFTALSPLTFTENQIDIDHISGNTAYLRDGVRTGATVVTVGAEELYGVQAGVLAQT